MRTLHHLPEERRIRIAQETRDIYAPIAHRLGMSKIKNELEELAFRHHRAGRLPGAAAAGGEPAARERGPAGRTARSDSPRSWRRRRFRSWPSRGASSACGRSTSSCSARTCRSISVYDFLALRVITPQREGLLRACSASSTRCGRRCPGRFKDFIAMSRPNGYQSLHTSVVERARPAVRSADPHRGDAPGRRGGHRRALEIQGRAARVRARRAVLPVAAAAARVAAGGARSAGVHAQPAHRAVPGGGLPLHAQGRGAIAAARIARRSTSPTRFTPTSATSASARA